MFYGEVILWVIAAFFVLAALFQLFFYLFFYLAPVTLKRDKRDPGNEAVSVIICARNEAANLERFLPSVLEQNYSNYEVVVVNDCSEDDSDILLNYLEQKYNHLRVSTIKKDTKFPHFKKFAMFIGIKAAKNELLLFTDADCEPVGPEWINKMASGFSEGKDIVLGYGGYFPQKGLLGKYIGYDTFFIAMQYFGMAARGLPYMGVGRNLAYRRSLFFQSGGFGKHNTLMSGDDDLFVQENGNATNVALMLEKESFTRSVPTTSFRQFVDRKRRHFTTAPHYKKGIKALLFMEPMTRVLFYASFIALLCYPFHWEIVLAIFGIRLTVQLIAYILNCRLFEEKNIVVLSLFFDIFSPFINGLIYITKGAKRTHKRKWK